MVDESLFGGKPAQNTNNGNNAPPTDMFSNDYRPAPQRKSGTRKPKKETVQVITKDLIRNLM